MNMYDTIILNAATLDEAIAAAETSGLHPRAQAELVREGSETRRALRMWATIGAAVAEAEEKFARASGLDKEEAGEEGITLYAAAVIARDLIGHDGPPLGLGAGRARREGWADDLGSGRWDDPDAEAYRDASRDAIKRLLDGRWMTLGPGADGRVQVSADDGTCITISAGSAILRRGMRWSLGLPAQVAVCDGVAFDLEPAADAWAAALESAEAEESGVLIVWPSRT